MTNIIPTPTKKKEILPIADYSQLENFLAEHYAPTNVSNWNEFLLTKKQGECRFSDHSQLTVQEYIDNVLSKMPDLSLQTLDSLEPTERFQLIDMLLRMNLDKIAETFGAYIFLFLIFGARHYGFGRFESYLEPYLRKHPEYTRNIGINKLDIIREATHRMSFESTTFGNRLLLFKCFVSLHRGVYQDSYNTILQKYIPTNALIHDLDIGHIYPFDKQPTGHSNWHSYTTTDINKDETYENQCYLDAPLALALFYKGVPVPVISAMLWNQNDFVMYQMPAISSKVYNGYGVMKGYRVNPITQEIPWQKILHECMSTVAQQEGAHNIYILPSEKNEWTETMMTTPVWDPRERRFKNVPIDVPHLSKKIAEQIYDVFAEKNGYHKDVSGFWIKDITQQSTEITSMRLSNTA